MAIDPAIPLSVRPPQIQSPMEAQGQVLALQNAQLGVQERSLQLHAQQALDQAFAGARMNADGSIDPQSLVQHLPGHLVPGVLQQINALNKNVVDLQSAHLGVAQKQMDLIAGLANGVVAAGYDPKTFLQAVQTARKTGLLDDATAQQYAIGAIEQGPDYIKQTTDGMVAQSKDWQNALSQKMRAAAAQQSAQTGADRLQAELPNISLQGQKLGQEVSGTVPIQPAQQQSNQIAAANLRLKTIETGLARSKNAREQQQFDMLYSVPGDENMPQNPVAQGIADYRIPAPSARTMASPQGQALMRQVLAANPSYDASQFPTRQKMRGAFTSGSQGQQLTALNTAIEHLGVLSDFADALKNGPLTPANALYNKVATVFGGQAPTNFEFARDIMSGELATAMKKSGATDQEITKVTGALSGAGSPAQLGGAIKDVAIPMIGGKARVLDEQYHATMGQQDPFSVYTPGAKAVLDKFGTAPAAKPGPAPDLSGLKAGHGRTFSDGPFKGQTWTVSPDGKPVKVSG